MFVAEGMMAVEAASMIGGSEQTYYRWRKEYGGMQVEQTKRLKTLEQENIRLKRLVAEKELDIQILKDARLCPEQFAIWFLNGIINPMIFMPLSSVSLCTALWSQHKHSSYL